MTFAEINREPGSIHDLFDTQTSALNEYHEDIEDADEDRIRCWLLENGVTDDDIEASEDQGLSLKDMAQDFYDQGYTL